MAGRGRPQPVPSPLGSLAAWLRRQDAPRRTTSALLDKEQLFAFRACNHVCSELVRLPGVAGLMPLPPCAKFWQVGRQHLCEIHLSKHQMQLTEASWPCLRLPPPSPQSCLLRKERAGSSRVLDIWLFGCPPITSEPPCGKGEELRAPLGQFARSLTASTWQPWAQPPRAGTRRPFLAAWPLLCLPSAWGLVARAELGEARNWPSEVCSSPSHTGRQSCSHPKPGPLCRNISASWKQKTGRVEP